jgi:N-methylhydantoinase A
MTTPRSLSVSADVGGTFTDVVTLDNATGEVTIGKSPTIADDPVESIVRALQTSDVSLAEMQRLVHGTTVGINTLLQRQGSTVGLLITEGFGHILEIAGSDWPAFRLTWQRPEALVTPELTDELHERVRADGTVLDVLSDDEVLAKATALVNAGVEAIAVCLLNSYVEPRHEMQAGKVIAEAFPDVLVVLSHQLTRRYRELPRTVTTVGEAYLRPRMQRYFDELRAGLHQREFNGQVFVTSSDGGVMGLDLARDRALRTLVSGCASGIAGAASVAAMSGWNDIIAIDMGGTSFDAAIIRNGHPAMLPTAKLAGFEFLMPMLDLATIGAGGGSIAAVDHVGSLSVGPRSAGSMPGPVCYGRGGTEPTVTDAAVVAGLLPTELLGGRMALSIDDAREAIAKHVAEPLDLTVDEAAAGILAVVEGKMAQLLEEMTIGQGLDPRTFTLFAYGGGGPLVAARLAEQLGCQRVVIPRYPGVFSAWGMQTLDAVQEFSRTYIVNPAGLTPEELGVPFDDMIVQARAALVNEGFSGSAITLLRFVEMRYESQEHTLLVPFDQAGEGALRAAFDAAHLEAFGFTVPGAAEIVTYLMRAIGTLPKPVHDPGAPAPSSTSVSGETRSRPVYERSVGSSTPWPVVDRSSLPSAETTAGPVIVEEATCTSIVPRGWSVSVDANGSLVMVR